MRPQDLLGFHVPPVSLDQAHQPLTHLVRVQLHRQRRLEHLTESSHRQARRSCGCMVALHGDAH